MPPPLVHVVVLKNESTNVTIRIKPWYDLNRPGDEVHTVTLMPGERREIAAEEFHDGSVSSCRSLVLMIYENSNQNPKGTLNPSHLIDFVELVFIPQTTGNMRIYGKRPVFWDILRRTNGLPFNRKYGSRPLEEIL